MKLKRQKLISFPMPMVSNATVKARSLKKAAAALPNSPRKNIETVKSLAKQSNLKVQYSN